MKGLARRIKKTTTVDRAVAEVARHMPADGDLENLIQALSSRRARPLRLLRYPLPADGPSGVWLDLPDKDYIVVAKGAPPSREAAIICHELGHIALGHAGPTLESPAELTSDFAPGIAPEVAARFLNRHSYEDAQERDAEAFATKLATEQARRATRRKNLGDGLSSRLR